MSELDIELKRQTGEVSLTEMLEVVDAMEVALPRENPENRDNLIGEEENVN